jgi:hypothetical protein
MFHTGATASFIALWFNNQGGREQTHANVVKRCSKHESMQHANSSHDAPSTSRDTTTISKRGPMIAEGPATLRVSRRNLPVRSESPRTTRVRDEGTQRGGQHLAHPEHHRGYLTSSSFVSESRSGGFLHAPPCGLAPCHLGFPTRDYLGKTLETT